MGMEKVDPGTVAPDQSSRSKKNRHSESAVGEVLQVGSCHRAQKMFAGTRRGSLSPALLRLVSSKLRQREKPFTGILVLAGLDREHSVPKMFLPPESAK